MSNKAATMRRRDRASCAGRYRSRQETTTTSPADRCRIQPHCRCECVGARLACPLDRPLSAGRGLNAEAAAVHAAIYWRRRLRCRWIQNRRSSGERDFTNPLSLTGALTSSRNAPWNSAFDNTRSISSIYGLSCWCCRTMSIRYNDASRHWSRCANHDLSTGINALQVFVTLSRF